MKLLLCLPLITAISSCGGIGPANIYHATEMMRHGAALYSAYQPPSLSPEK
jgi:hypothetical protein